MQMKYYIYHKQAHYTNKYLKKKGKKLALAITYSRLMVVVSMKTQLVQNNY